MNEHLNLDQIVENGRAEGRLEGPAKLGFFEIVKDGVKSNDNADNVCVLVAHYDFKNTPNNTNGNDEDDDFRDGDAQDVQNLRRSFKEKRNCTFRELLSPKKEALLGLLASEEKLLRFFSSEGEVPSVFILFVLSHGQSGGKIYTDHWDEGLKDYTHFTTMDVFESVRKLKNFSSCLKLVNFGPCRGDLDDLISTADQSNPKFIQSYSNRNSCNVTYFPKIHNLVLFYSTVETMKARRNKLGSWLGRTTTEVLDTMREDKSLPHFFTSMQFRIHLESRDNSDMSGKCYGQTPEVKIFPQDKKFFISALPKYSQAATGPSQSRGEGKGKMPPPAEEPSEYFSWQSDKKVNIRGRRAVIFCEEPSQQVRQLNDALSHNLSFDTSLRKLSCANLERHFEDSADFESGVGCLMTCLFGEVVELAKQNSEVCVRVDNKKVPIGNIIHKLVGPKNSNWIGKPKIFIAIHQKTDGTELGHLPSLKAESIQATNHSGWLVLILQDKVLIEKFIEILNGKLLKEGKSLQEQLLLLSIANAESSKTLHISTLQYLLDFPDWPRFYVKPNFQLEKTTDDQPTKETISYSELLEKVQNTVENYIWLISSVAGAGKSTTMQEVAYDLGKRLPQMKILRVSLGKMYSYLLKNKPPVITLEDFLAKATHCAPDEIRELLEARKAILFLDGFDEICPSFREVVMHMVTTLHGKLRVSVWIGTRPQEAEAIHFQFKNTVIKMNILPLEHDQQVELLQMLTNKEQKECEEILNGFDKKDMLGNPLHLTLVTQCKNARNLYEIYDEVLREKVEKCLVEKEGYDKDHDKFPQHMEKALALIKSLAFQFMTKKELIDSEKSEDYERLNDMGIATVVSGHVTFLHQTFAEFLTAQKFISDLHKSGDSEVKLFEENSLEQCRKFVDMFFSTITNVEALELQTMQLFNFFGKHAFSLGMICSENLTKIFSMLKPLITFDSSEQKPLYVEKGAALLSDSINSEEIALQLLEMGAIRDEEELSKNLYKMLHFAAWNNSVAFLNKLKEIFPALSEIVRSERCVFKAGVTATDRGNHQVLDVLLEIGVDVNYARLAVQQMSVPNKSPRHAYECALYIACKRGEAECMQVLLKHGVSLDIRFEAGRSALLLAAWHGHLAIAEMLVLGCKDQTTQTIDIAQKDNLGCNALHLAASNGHLAVAAFLHSQNSSLAFEKSDSGKSPLHMAASGKHLEMCKWLVHEVGVDVHVVDDEGRSVLHEACGSGDWQTGDFLLTLGVDVQIKDKKGKTALHCAARGGQAHLVQKMLNLGADLNAKDEDGRNVLHCALNGGEMDMAKLLHKRSGDLVKDTTNDGETALHLTIASGWSYCGVEMHRWLVEEAGVDVQAADKEGRTALHLACKRGKIDTVKMLLDNELVCIRATDKNGWNALHFAAKGREIEVVKLLLEKDIGLLKEIPLPLPLEELTNQEILEYLNSQ